MTGVAVQIIEQGMADAMAKIDALADLDRHELMDSLGRLVQRQTRRRIETEKTAPDGSDWKPNRAGSSILYASHTLAQSIDYITTQTEVHVGSPLVYAAIHQFGGVIKAKNAKALRWFAPGGNGQPSFAQSVTIPARPYLGMSADNIEEAEEVVTGFINEVLGHVA